MQTEEIEPEESEPLEILTVTFGGQKFSPVAYHSFEIGNIYYKTVIRKGETPEQAYARAWAFLEKAAREQYKAARACFYDNYERP